MVLHKTWRCKQNARKKPSGSSGASCPAKIDIKIKKTNRHTKKNDAFLRRPSPLPAVIRLWHQEGHSHSTTSADALRRLGPATTTKETFVGYFEDAMSPAEAIRLHESKLLVQEGGFTLLANAALNPLPAAVYYWHRLWRQENFGKHVDPLDKLTEKMPAYEEQGEHALLTCATATECGQGEEKREALFNSAQHSTQWFLFKLLAAIGRM